MRSLVCILIAALTLAGCTGGGFLSPPAGSIAESPPLISVTARTGMTGTPAATPLTVGQPSSRTPAPGGLLIRGTEAVRGLPGFGRNAIPALAGTYLVQSREGRPPVAVQVWASRERLYFKPAQWEAVPIPANTALASQVSRRWRQNLGYEEVRQWLQNRVLQERGVQERGGQETTVQVREAQERVVQGSVVQGSRQLPQAGRQGDGEAGGPAWIKAGSPGESNTGGKIGVLFAYEVRTLGPESTQWDLFILETTLDASLDTPPGVSPGASPDAQRKAEEETLLAKFYQNLINRFVYFLGSARRPEDVSLPAFVAF